MPAWLLWVIVAAVLGGVEMLSLTLVAGLLAVAAVAAAQVLELVDAQHGRVRIGGEVWSARAYVPEQVIPVGAVVDVFEIRGATALVHAEETTT